MLVCRYICMYICVSVYTNIHVYRTEELHQKCVVTHGNNIIQIKVLEKYQQFFAIRTSSFFFHARPESAPSRTLTHSHINIFVVHLYNIHIYVYLHVILCVVRLYVCLFAITYIAFLPICEQEHN